MLNPVRLAAVAMGGAAGAVTRYALSGWMAVATKSCHFLDGALSVNVLGTSPAGVRHGYRHLGPVDPLPAGA